MFTEAFPIVTVPSIGAALEFYVGLLGFHETYRFPAKPITAGPATVHPKTAGPAPDRPKKAGPKTAGPKEEPEFVVIRLGANELGLSFDQFATPSDSLEMCVYADDCDRAVALLRSAGVLVIEDPSDQRWGERMARVLDPAGNRVMIVSREEKRADEPG